MDDLVLLEDISNQGILNTLRQRYNANLIYVRRLFCYAMFNEWKSANLTDLHWPSVDRSQSLSNASHLWQGTSKDLCGAFII